MTNITRLNDHLLAISATITIVSAVLSILGGLLIIWSYSAIVETQNRVRDLLVSLTIADIATAFGNGIGSIRWFVLPDNTTAAIDMCIGQSFLTTFSSMSSFLWTISIAVYLFCCVSLRRAPLFTRQRLIMIHIFIWGVPGGITMTAYILKVLGNNRYALNGVWCWLNLSIHDTNGIFWMLISGKGWEISTYIIIAVLYMMMKINTFKQKKKYGKVSSQWNHFSQELRREDEIYCMSCLILYCLRLWGTIRFILDLVRDSTIFPHWYDNSIGRVFLYLQSYGDSSQAFWNFILFCVCDGSVRAYVKARFFKRCPVECANFESVGERTHLIEHILTTHSDDSIQH